MKGKGTYKIAGRMLEPGMRDEEQKRRKKVKEGGGRGSFKGSSGGGGGEGWVRGKASEVPQGTYVCGGARARKKKQKKTMMFRARGKHLPPLTSLSGLNSQPTDPADSDPKVSAGIATRAILEAKP